MFWRLGWMAGAVLGVVAACADVDEDVDPQVGASRAALFAEPLPGRSARTVLDENVNEGENLFFTEDGRLFVSASSDIFEITRAPDGTYKKTDHFAGDWVVEGIVRSGNYLYGVCWHTDDSSLPGVLVAGELTAQPVIRPIAPIDGNTAPNGMTVDPEGQIYITYSLTGQIMRVTLASPLEVERFDVWAENISIPNGIKYADHALYVTQTDLTLVNRLLRLPILPDGSAGSAEELYERPFAVFDDILPFAGGFIISDFLNGTLMFWHRDRGLYAETPAQTFYGPTALALGQPPMFNDRQLIIPEKGMFLVRDEIDGDLLSVYQLP